MSKKQGLQYEPLENQQKAADLYWRIRVESEALSASLSYLEYLGSDEEDSDFRQTSDAYARVQRLVEALRLYVGNVEELNTAARRIEQLISEEKL